MSKDEVLSYFYTNSTSYGVKRTLVILCYGLAAAMILYLTYYFTSEKTAYNRKFNCSLIALLLITVIVMLLISSNIAMSLGMVGALSIVRFRTAVKDSRDTVFIFWAMAEGLCVSSQNYRLAFTSVLFISAVLVISSKIPGIYHRYLLIIRAQGESVNREYLASALKPFTAGYVIRTANKDAHMEELILEVKTRGELNLDVIDALMSLSGIEAVNWVVSSGETVG